MSETLWQQQQEQAGVTKHAITFVTSENFVLLFFSSVFSCLVIVDWMDISAVQFLIASQMNYCQTFLHCTCHLKEDLPGASTNESIMMNRSPSVFYFAILLVIFYKLISRYCTGPAQGAKNRGCTMYKRHLRKRIFG